MTLNQEDKISTRALGVALLSVTASTEDMARHLVKLMGSPEAGLQRLNEVLDEMQRHMASIALHLRTSKFETTGTTNSQTGKH